MAREELAIEAGVDLAKFDAAAAPFEKKVGPWLKKSLESGKEVIRVVRFNPGKNGARWLSRPRPSSQTASFTVISLNTRRPTAALPHESKPGGTNVRSEAVLSKSTGHADRPAGNSR